MSRQRRVICRSQTVQLQLCPLYPRRVATATRSIERRVSDTDGTTEVIGSADALIGPLDRVPFPKAAATCSTVGTGHNTGTSSVEGRRDYCW